MNKVLLFPGVVELPGLNEDSPSAPMERDPVTTGVPGDAWEAGRSRRTFECYCWHKNGDGVRYTTPSGAVTIFKADWEAWCRRAQLVADGAVAKQSAEDAERDHWRVAYGFIDYAILETDCSHLAAVWTPTDKAMIQRLTRWWIRPDTAFHPGGRTANRQELALPPFGRYTFGWGVAVVCPILHEQDCIRDHKQIRIAWWICGMVSVRFEVDGHQWRLPSVPAEVFHEDRMLRFRASIDADTSTADHATMTLCARNAAVLRGLWQATQAAAKLGQETRAVIRRTKGERVVQPVLVRGDADDPTTPETA